MSDSSAANPHPGMSFPEFVALMAALMAMMAAAIDSMLPGLPQIARSLSVSDPNHQQLVVTAFLIGAGAGQIVYGPLADRFGRKPVLLMGLSVYAVFALMAALSPNFESLLLARLIQGLGAAGARVLPTSIIRDCYSGRRMAQVSSFAALVFMGVPIVAPTLGQALLAFASWRVLFAVLACLALANMAWVTFRLPETLKPQDRLPINPGRIAKTFGQVLADRASLGYSLALTALYVSLFAFVNSAQQVFADVFGAAKWFPLIFAACAVAIAGAALVNASLVRRLGSRKISHLAVIGYLAASGLDALLALTHHQTLLSFSLLQAACMFCFGLTGGNFTAMAMEKMGHIAGSASSVQGFIVMVGGAIGGFIVGQAFDGTVVPITLGYVFSGVLAIAACLWAEHGRLFRAHHAGPGPEQGDAAAILH